MGRSVDTVEKLWVRALADCAADWEMSHDGTSRKRKRRVEPGRSACGSRGARIPEPKSRPAQPSRAEFVARYPEIAEPLAECLAGLEFVQAAAPQLSQPLDGIAPTGEPEALATGVLGDFRIIREVGRGGMGVVYEAEQISLGRRVALKVLPFAATMDPRHLQRFQNEARAAAGLHHTNIVPVYAVGCERGVHFYAMQFIEGQTLAALIAELRQRGGQTRRPADATDDAARAGAPAADTAERAAASTDDAALDKRLTSAAWPSGASRRPRRWTMPTSWASSTATSSRPTCWWTPPAACG